MELDEIYFYFNILESLEKSSVKAIEICNNALSAKSFFFV